MGVWIFVMVVFVVNGWYMLSGRISESVPVRQDGTMLRESSVRHTKNPAMQFTICYATLFFIV